MNSAENKNTKSISSPCGSSFLNSAKRRVLDGELLSREDAVLLADEPLFELCQAADEIRSHFCGNNFDLCSIVNGKCGRCSEDCRYCAQSVHYHTSCTEEYPLLSSEELLRQALSLIHI